MERIVSHQPIGRSIIKSRLNLATEIATLRKEAQEWQRMREALRASDAIAGRTVFEKVIDRSRCHKSTSS